MKKSLLYAVLLFGVSSFASAASIFTTPLDDPKAVYLTAQQFGVHADGVGDDTSAIQSAVDKAEGNAREGIVFCALRTLPPLTRTALLYLARRASYRLRQRERLSSCLPTTLPAFKRGVSDMVIFARRKSSRRPPLR